jgi:hypothetical protein
MDGPASESDPQRTFDNWHYAWARLECLSEAAATGAIVADDDDRAETMIRFDLNSDFSVDCTVADKSRSGQIYHVRSNVIGTGKMLTGVARYFAWQPDFVEGYNRYWRVDCFVTHHPLAPHEPMVLGQALVAALIREKLCAEPIWLSSHRSNDEKGRAYGDVFED